MAHSANGMKWIKPGRFHQAATLHAFQRCQRFRRCISSHPGALTQRNSQGVSGMFCVFLVGAKDLTKKTVLFASATY